MFDTILVTGGCGFIGSNFILACHRRFPGTRIVNLDALTYAGNPANLAEVEGSTRYEFVRGDICDGAALDRVLPGVPAIVHFAAESHVDRSILSAQEFIRTNVVGTQTLLDAARRHGVGRFVYVSTDEVYGSLGAQGKFTESSPIAPNSPYAASKAAGDLLARAAFHTHGLPLVTTRCTNNYGPRQFPEKLIPLVIANAIAGRPIPVYGRGANVRNWIHVDDHCEALLAVLERGEPGAVYNIGGDDEVDNLTLVKTLLRILGQPEDLIRFVPDRPGHDFRYALDSTFARRELAWEPRTRFESGLAATVAWYRENAAWVEHIRSGEYQRYYREQYADRLAQTVP